MKNEIKDQIVILMVQQEDLYNFLKKTTLIGEDWPIKLEKFYIKIGKNIETLKKENFSKKYTINGYIDDNSIEYIEIDELINKNWPNDPEIITDSESGQFFCYTTYLKSKEIVKWLKNKYGELITLNVSNNDDILTPFINWHESRKYVEDNKLEVPSLIDNKIISKINTFFEEINILTEKISKVENNLSKFLDTIQI